MRLVEGLLYDLIAVSDVPGCKIEIALNETLNDIEDDTVSKCVSPYSALGVRYLRFVMHPEYRTTKGKRQTIHI